MHLEGKQEKHILFLADGNADFTVGVKAHTGAGVREVSVPRVHAYGEEIDRLLGQDLSAAEIILAAFVADDTSPNIFRPQRGVQLEVHIPGEGLLRVKSDTVTEVERKAS